MTVETAASANQPSAESDKEYNFAKLRKLVDQERELRIQAEQERQAVLNRVAAYRDAHPQAGRMTPPNQEIPPCECPPALKRK